jgi:hypothetical protein
MADSLAAAGWRVGLREAYSVSVRLERYDAALRFLDLVYATHGSVSLGGRRESAEDREREYQRERTWLQDKMAEQEQRQR